MQKPNTQQSHDKPGLTDFQGNVTSSLLWAHDH